MIHLTVTSNYTSGFGAFTKGQELELDDHVAELLLRDSPGSFEVTGKAMSEEPEPDVSAMSTETMTGLVAPDRRARGGRVR